MHVNRSHRSLLLSDAVAQKVTEQIDAEELMKKCNAMLDRIEALMKPNSPPPEECDVVNDLIMDEINPILGCKDHIISLLKQATEAAGQSWEKDRLPWGTLMKYLVGISPVITGWPASCPFPHKTMKPKKSKRNNKEANSQGIKDLGTKHGRVLLTALQVSQIKFIKADPNKIKRNITPVIATSAPTHDDPPSCRAQSLFANGQVFLGA
ncbi:hypothetical protein C0993_003125, partial [Termitomyces sp. T159_Od127]